MGHFLSQTPKVFIYRICKYSLYSLFPSPTLLFSRLYSEIVTITFSGFFAQLFELKPKLSQMFTTLISLEIRYTHPQKQKLKGGKKVFPSQGSMHDF